jgi:hypothetical protein
MHHAARQQERGRNTYEFAAYVACIHCGLPLRCQGHSVTKHLYYRDTAKSRRLPCTNGGELTIRADLVAQQFGELLKSLVLPDTWREDIRRQMVKEALVVESAPDTMEREKERLKLKKVRILKHHREGYIDDEEFYGEMAAVELALHQMDVPEVNGVKYDDVIEAGEHIPGMAALWDVGTPEERRDMVMILVEPGGLYYDLENKIIAAIKPRPAFLPILRMLNGVVEYDEAKGLLVTERWQDRNRRASATLSPVLIHFVSPSSYLSQKLQLALNQLQGNETPPLPLVTKRRLGPAKPNYGIPPADWPMVQRRVLENQEPLRKVASDYGVSYETVRRTVIAAQKPSKIG